VKFITPIWNPYVDYKSGKLCLDILEHNWSPAFALPQILISIISLFSERSPQNEALNVEAAAEMKLSYKKF
jgi:ubiquitin-protein ligase